MIKLLKKGVNSSLPFNISNYIADMSTKSESFSISDVLTLIPQLNPNTKSFIAINKLCGWYYPIDPHSLFALCDELLIQFERNLKKNTTLIITFSKTSTLFAQYIASQLQNCVFILNLPDNFDKNNNILSTLSFPLHKLYKFNNILLVCDIVIEHNLIIDYKKHLNKIMPYSKCSLVTICDFQSYSSKQVIKDNHIKTYSLFDGILTLPNTNIIPSYTDSTIIYRIFENQLKIKFYPFHSKLVLLTFDFLVTKPLKLKTYLFILYVIFKDLLDTLLNKLSLDILVIGTEDFYFTSLLFSNMLQKYYKVNSSFKSITSVNIKLPVNYQELYLYNLSKYDKILIFLHSNFNDDFVFNLSEILRMRGCRELNFIVTDDFLKM